MSKRTITALSISSSKQGQGKKKVVTKESSLATAHQRHHGDKTALKNDI